MDLRLEDFITLGTAAKNAINRRQLCRRFGCSHHYGPRRGPANPPVAGKAR